MKSKKHKLLFILTGLVVLIIIIAIIFLTRFFITKKDVNDIMSIEITQSPAYLDPKFDYLIDFNSNTISLEIKDGNNISAEYYIKTYELDSAYSSKTFSEQDKVYFIKKANLYGMFRWRKLYKHNGYIADGVLITIHINYNDGSRQEICFDNAFPLTYNKMKKVFSDSFGWDIL